MEDTISIIMPIYNQGNIIANIIKGVAENISDNVKEAIFIFDGCTDNTEEEFEDVVGLFNIPVITFKLSNVNEVLSNNTGIKRSRCKYSLTIQDDCLIREKDFDKRLNGNTNAVIELKKEINGKFEKNDEKFDKINERIDKLYEGRINQNNK